METKIQVVATGSKGNCYILHHEGKQIILDAGVKFSEIKEALNYDLSQVLFAIVTHAHQDHCKCMKDLIDSGIEVVAGKEIYETVYMDAWEQMASVQSTHNTEDWIVKRWSVDHDVPNYAYLLYHKKTGRKLAYITDTSHVTLIPATVDTLICEVSYCDECLETKQNELGERFLRLRQYHMGLNRFKEMLEVMKQSDGYCLKNIVIVHLSDSNSNAEQIKREVEKVTGIKPAIATRKAAIGVAIENEDT